MFFSEYKLRELANIDKKITTEEIVKAINSIGFEVEDVFKFNFVENIKFGHVLKTYPNPESEKLTVCEIKFADKIRIIQTAAKNVKSNDYVMAFIPGSKLNGNEIQSKKMANITSEGMLISYPELGFKSELLTKYMNENILILDKVDLNKDPIDLFQLHDNIIEVSILSNRSDAQSYYSFAKELSAYFHSKYTPIPEKKKEYIASDISIKLDNENFLNGMKVQIDEFNIDIQDIFLLLKSNIKIDDNKYINFANLTLIYTGVSLRAFDCSKISNNISIKKEKDIWYLNDSKQNISILGVDVIKEFLPSNNSQNVFFEFSQINEKIVRENSKNSKLVTYSSINNSRVISKGMILLAFNFINNYFSKTSQLINEIDQTELNFKFDEEYINNYAGFDIREKTNYKKALKSLEILDFKISKNKINIPIIRHDVKNMQHIVEEIFRFYGLNNFSAEPISQLSLYASSLTSLEKQITYLSYTQVMTYTLISENKNWFNPFQFQDVKKLKTYVSEDHNSIRNSLALPIADVFEYNFKKNIKSLSLFDKGMINDQESLIIASTVKTYNEIKKDIELISNQKFQVIPLNNDDLHPNYNAGLYLSGKLVGWIGKIHPLKLSLDKDIIFGEILLNAIYSPKNKFIEFDSSPLKERDITFEIKQKEDLDIYLHKLESIEGIFSIEKISEFQKDNVNKLTYRILMSESAIQIFDNTNWQNIKELM